MRRTIYWYMGISWNASSERCISGNLPPRNSSNQNEEINLSEKMGQLL